MGRCLCGRELGAGSNTACGSLALSGAAIDPSVGSVFYNRACPGKGCLSAVCTSATPFKKAAVWSFGADSTPGVAKNYARSLRYAGNVPPPGTYAFSGKLTPTSFSLIGPRIGYAGDRWMPYLRFGAIITVGSGDSAVSYVATGTAKPTVSFSGGRNPAAAGWVAGGGAELVLSGPWSISAEYLHASLDNGSKSVATCAGTASACAAFDGISLDSARNGFTANLFRIGVNYWFGY